MPPHPNLIELSENAASVQRTLGVPQSTSRGWFCQE